MDGVSAAASITGIISITIQLADSIKKLYNFLADVADAPEEIKETVQELRLVSKFLERIRENESNQSLDPIAVEALENCNRKVNKLLNVLHQWESSYTSGSHRVRTWSSFKATFKKDKVDRLKLSLEEAKTTLILVRQDLSE
jgi:hypothetical protein